MFNGLIAFLIDIFLKFISTCSTIVFLPIFLTLEAFVPDFTDYLIIIDDFINNYIIKGVAFFREVMFNVTGFPRALFNVLIGYLVFKLGLMIVKQVIKMVVNAYFFVRGSSSK